MTSAPLPGAVTTNTSCSHKFTSDSESAAICMLRHSLIFHQTSLLTAKQAEHTEVKMEWTHNHLGVTKDGVVEQDAEEHKSQGNNFGPGELSDA